MFCGATSLRPLRFMLFQNQFAKIDFHRLLTPSFHSSLFFVNRLAARVMQQAQKADRNMHRAK
ncbi:MAG: hypothetical protein MR515_08100, partial [Acidaminococcus fermentans]|uniref:hypothetical protein n=1 Tax=Acidaminococcus fermentans TaxID=905 RepID=UPI00242EB68D